MSSTEDLIAFAAGTNPIDFASTVNDLLRGKALAAIEAKKVELAQAIFPEDGDEEDFDVDAFDVDETEEDQSIDYSDDTSETDDFDIDFDDDTDELGDELGDFDGDDA